MLLQRSTIESSSVFLSSKNAVELCLVLGEMTGRGGGFTTVHTHEERYANTLRLLRLDG